MSDRLTPNEKELWLGVAALVVFFAISWVLLVFTFNTQYAWNTTATDTICAVASAEIILERRVDFLEARLSAEAETRDDHDREIWSTIASEEE